ncbi:hypothetical protein NIES4071_105150 (plasmid) [Calothrix sp. NIES-4071]|nr:hypothetical protein NIES4071_105150 [Calothrix sp. NIES-4071]BAZ64933.1 hypothetical protein NIES4105_106660 [Calothrix sp. NIES-4105]
MISQNIAVGTSIGVPATSDVVNPQVGQAPIPAGYITEISLLVTAFASLVSALKKDSDDNDDDNKKKKGSDDKDGDNKSD